MEKINKKIFPEDFFDLPTNQDEIPNEKNRSKQKEHPKLLNPSNTIKIIPPAFSEIKEEAFEESVEHLQVKKTNLKIIIPDKSNDELEPSTSGSSNVKLSPSTPSPLICAEKNKFKIYPGNNKIISHKDKCKNKEEDAGKITARFANEEKKNNFSKDNKILKRPSTPSINRLKRVYNPPLTSENKKIDKFNYNFETKKNGVIIPKNENKINKIQRQNLFKVGYNCNNVNRNQKINKNNNKLNPVSSRIAQIFGSQENSSRESPCISFKNNLNENNNNNKNTEYNTNKTKKKTLKKNKNTSFIEEQKNSRKNRANSMENKFINRKNNVCKKNELNKDTNNKDDDKKMINKKERKKHLSYNKNNILPYLSEVKFKNVKNQLETEINNMFNNLPEDYENYPELKNYIEKIVKNIHGLKDYIYKNTQITLKKTNNNISKIKK